MEEVLPHIAKRFIAHIIVDTSIFYSHIRL